MSADAEEDDRFAFRLVVPTAHPVAGDGRIRAVEATPGPAATTMHVGP